MRLFSKIIFILSLISCASVPIPDQEAVLIEHVEPNYYWEAVRDGYEGFVELEFDVLPDGTTDNINVFNANPRRIFDRSAKRAVKQWIYQPKILNGKAVISKGHKVRLEFKIDSKV